jgi:hypothetical protein
MQMVKPNIDPTKLVGLYFLKTSFTKTKKQTPWLEPAGANYTDRATAACRRS